MNINCRLIAVIFVCLFYISGCGKKENPVATDPTYPEVDREDKIPADIT